MSFSGSHPTLTQLSAQLTVELLHPIADTNTQALKLGMLITVWIGLAVVTFLIARRFFASRGWDIDTILKRKAPPSTLPTLKVAPSPQPSLKFSPNTLSAPALSRANSSVDGTQSVASPQPLLGPQAFRPRVPWSQTASSFGPDAPLGPISRSRMYQCPPCGQSHLRSYSVPWESQSGPSLKSQTT